MPSDPLQVEARQSTAKSFYKDDWLEVWHGDCRAVMAEMEPESVHCVVTSPPYWGLRDYGDPGQLGLEPTPEEYVANLVAVFREVRRVLRKDGTVWLNLGDSYGLKPKDLVGIPWRVAFALQADGWYLRSDIIWSKPNPMPESVTDRPTKSHEYLFLLAKSARYYFDADAVREAGSENSHGALGIPSARNIRSVWTIATAPYPGAHFATFPPKLIEPCIKAGTSERGVCPECGAPWERETQTTREVRTTRLQAFGAHVKAGGGNSYSPVQTVETTGWRPGCIHAEPPVAHDDRTWDPASNPRDPIPAIVLDPFAGSGTTGLVAQSLSRRAVLIDLSLDYLGQLMDRNADIPLGLGA